MAKSENQSLQVAVILFAFVTIALSVATFYFFNEATANLENRLAADEKAKTADAALREALIEIQNLKEKIIGVDRDMKYPNVFNAKVELLGELSAAMPDKDESTFFTALRALLSTVGSTKGDVKVALKHNDELVTQNKDDKAADRARHEAVKKAFEKRSKDSSDRVIKLGRQDTEHVKKEKQLIGIIKEKTEDFAALQAEKEKELGRLKNDLAALERDLREVMADRYEAENWNFDRPDGRIVSVNARRNTVWINIGRADELRLNIKFKVFKRGHDNVYQRQPKGAIEVTRFLGRGMAEARIVTYKDEDPILDGDVIFTPIWSPGEPEIFVIAGDFDLNGDKKPDNKLIRRLIHMSGGVIEEKLTINTRYLLLGASAEDAAASVETLRKDAEQKGIRIMSLRQFIEYIDMGRWFHGLNDLNNVLRNREAFKKDHFKPRVPRSETRRLEAGAQLSGSFKERTSQPSRRSSSF